MSKTTNKLLAETKTHRLVVQHYAGLSPYIVLEHKSEDAMGAVCWKTILTSFDDDEYRLRSVMTFLKEFFVPEDNK